MISHHVFLSTIGALLTSSTAMLLSPVAFAADLPADDGEILVTAQRRPEAILSTPLAIAALSERDIVDRRLNDVQDIIAYTPGFSGNSDDSFIDNVAVRGIVSNDYGIGGDPAIGVFKDGVYQGRSGSVVTALFDIERAEALRGPQGFLFGRNAISGAISVITNKPRLDAPEGHVYLQYGEERRFEGEAALSLPLSDKFAARLAGYHASARGWIENAFAPGKNNRILGGHKTAIRPSLLYEAGPLRIVATGEYERRRMGGPAYRASNDDREVLDAIDAALGTTTVIRGGPRSVDSDLVDPRDDGTIYGLAVQADLDLDFATLSAITAYRRHTFFYSEDYDGTPLLLGNYTQRQRGSYASEEVRLVSPGGRNLTWSFGLSGYREKVRALFTNEAAEDAVCRAGYGYADCDALTQDLYGTAFAPAPGGVLIDVNKARTLNYGLSAYGDVNYNLTPRLQAGVGVRYTWDRKKFGLNILPTDSALGNVWTFTYYTDGFVNAARSWNGVTPRGYLRYQVTPDLNVYASLTRGYKAGGFGSFTVDSPSPLVDFDVVPAGTRPDDFSPETIWSKELGIKGSLLDRRLSFDLTGFHFVYRNLQTVYFDPETRTQQVINVGRARGYGVEFSATVRPSRYFDISGNATYTRTVKRGERDCALRDCGGLPNPIWASSGAATLHYPLGAAEAFLAGEWSYQGRRRESYDWRGITRRKGYVAVNLRAGYRSDSGWEAELYVQNLLDTVYYRGTENNGDLTPSNVWGVSQARNVGAALRWRFGS